MPAATDAPVVVRSAPFHAAVIRLELTHDELRTAMGPAIGEVLQAVAAQGLAPTGPVFSHHFRHPTTTFDLEVGVPVATPVTPSGRVVPTEMPARTVARTVHRGAYEELGPAWGAFEAWLGSSGHEAHDDLWESYVVGPESGDDPTTWRTELNRPLRGFERELVTTRVIDAPAERVFAAWLDADVLARWWGPDGFRTTFHAFDATPGGRWLFTMHAPDGTDHANETTLLEVDAPRRLRLSHDVQPPFELVATFTERDGRTELFWRQVFPTAEAAERIAAYAGSGNEQTLDRLEAVLAERPATT